MNRLQQLLQNKKEGLLAVYFTAGYPELNDTVTIIKALDKAGADIVEIGMPFSDPLADGETIQQSSIRALHNGMSLKLLFEQIKHIRQFTDIPILLMGYLNPVYKFGVERFVRKCRECGVDGTILPDLPLHEYQKHYRQHYQENGLSNILLITPQTPAARIYKIDKACNGFIYMVSSASTTGAKKAIALEQEAYFKRIDNLKLKTPRLIGFGISNHETFMKSCQYANGAIIGSAFIKKLEEEGSIEEKVSDFIKMIKSGIQ